MLLDNNKDSKISLSDYIDGKHVCSLYSSKANQIEELSSFLAKGLPFGDLCIFSGDPALFDEIILLLEAKGIDAKSFLEKKTLQFLTPEQTYFNNTEKKFNRKFMLDFLCQLEKETMDKGYGCLRFAGDASWLVKPEVNLEEFMLYESEVNNYVKNLNVKFLCLYDVSIFDDNTLKKVFFTHEQIKYNNIQTKNPFYLSSTQYESQKSDELDLQTFIKSLTQRQNELNIIQQQKLELEKKNIQLSREIERRIEIEQEMKLQSEIINQTREAIITTDENFNIRYMNKNAILLYDITPIKASKIGFDGLFGAKIDRERLKAVVQKRGEWTGELDQFLPNGQKISVICTISVLNLHNSDSSSFLIINSDNREKKFIEAQIAKDEKLRSVGLLAAGISHDLNNIFTPLQLTLDMLQNSMNNSEEKDLLQDSSKNLKRGIQLVKQLTSFYSKDTMEFEIIDIRDFVSDFVRMVSEIIKKTATINYRISEDVDAIYANYSQLEQLFLNLCINAKEAMTKRGTIDIVIDTFTVSDEFFVNHPNAIGENYIRFSFRDNGHGIDEAIIDDMFNPFFTTKGPENTGLGLMVVHSVVNNHKGIIEIKSEAGKGSEFIIYLPIYEL